MERFRSLSQPARVIFWLVLTGLVAGMLYAVFSTQLGQSVLLLCCGGGALVVVVGLVSEAGMRRKS